MTLPIIALLSGVLWLPFAAAAAEPSALEEPQDVIAPTLVLQGEFALQLAREFALPAEDVQAAVRALTALHIEPAAGWVLDYPATPRILAQLREAVVAAAAAGRLARDTDRAAAAFDRLLAELELPQPAAELSPYRGEVEGAAMAYLPPCRRSAFERYYDAYGAPLYTYCRPPPAYYGLYAWVPHGYYWNRFHFTGYFVLHHIHAAPHGVHPDRRVRGLKRKLAHDRPPVPAIKQTTGSAGTGDGGGVRSTAPAPGSRSALKGGGRIGRIVVSAPRAAPGSIKRELVLPGRPRDGAGTVSPPAMWLPPRTSPQGFAAGARGDLKRAIAGEGVRARR